MALRAALLAVAATALFLVPAASAHTETFSTDHKVRASIGLLNEPVSTYAVTGLDICFTDQNKVPQKNADGKDYVNTTTANLLKATLTAPSGSTHTADLKTQFGRAGCVTFTSPLVLTEPGQYTVAVTMSGAALFNGTTFDLSGVKAGGSVTDRADITFPATGVPDDKVLQEKVTALEARIAVLESDAAAALADKDDDSGKFAAGAPGPLIMVGLAALVVVLRRSQA